MSIFPRARRISRDRIKRSTAAMSPSIRFDRRDRPGSRGSILPATSLESDERRGTGRATHMRAKQAQGMQAGTKPTESTPREKRPSGGAESGITPRDVGTMKSVAAVEPKLRSALLPNSGQPVAAVTCWHVHRCPHLAYLNKVARAAQK